MRKISSQRDDPEFAKRSSIRVREQLPSRSADVRTVLSAAVGYLRITIQMLGNSHSLIGEWTERRWANVWCCIRMAYGLVNEDVALPGAKFEMIERSIAPGAVHGVSLSEIPGALAAFNESPMGASISPQKSNLQRRTPSSSLDWCHEVGGCKNPWNTSPIGTQCWADSDTSRGWAGRTEAVDIVFGAV